MTQLRISIDEGERHVRNVVVSKPLVTIGRGSGCDIRVGGEQVSSTHARLRIYSDRAFIEDLNSTNGVKVNGLAVNGEMEIGRGSLIELGSNGPRLQVIGGLPVLMRTDEHDSQANRHLPGKKSQDMLIAAVCIGVALLLTFGVLTALGVSLLWYSNQSKNVVHSILDEARIKQAVGQVIVGYETADSPPKFGALIAGSAFAITSDGFLITNKHVIERVQDGSLEATIESLKKKNKALTEGTEFEIPTIKRILVWAAFDGEFYPAEIRYVSAEHDMGILKIDRSDMPSFQLSSKDALPDLLDVYTLGFPGAAEIPLSESEVIEAQLRNGPQPNIKSCFKKRDFTQSEGKGTITRISVEAGGQRWIQHSATMSPGNSGGPLCVADGAVVGINTLLHRQEAGVYWSLMIDQLRGEIDSVTKSGRWVR